MGETMPRPKDTSRQDLIIKYVCLKCKGMKFTSKVAFDKIFNLLRIDERAVAACLRMYPEFFVRTNPNLYPAEYVTRSD